MSRYVIASRIRACSWACGHNRIPSFLFFFFNFQPYLPLFPEIRLRPWEFYLCSWAWRSREAPPRCHLSVSQFFIPSFLSSFLLQLVLRPFLPPVLLASHPASHSDVISCFSLLHLLLFASCFPSFQYFDFLFSSFVLLLSSEVLYEESSVLYLSAKSSPRNPGSWHNPREWE